MNNLNPSGLYCAYLRKSRRDVELEMLGGGDTLARHERELRDLAKSLGIVIAQTYREVVSGDTIADRPQMRQLLDDVSRDAWDGVLVVDVDRLGRGDSIDQGVIMQTFAYSQTLIITPGKIYDPDVDSDEESVEFKFFFSRFEYRTIKKRLMRGRLASAMDGCYMGRYDTYGYERVKLQGRKGWSLKPVPDQAAIVRAVYEWYVYGLDGHDMGVSAIARRLNDMGLRTLRGSLFWRQQIIQILTNPVYCGKIRYNNRVSKYSIVDGKRERRVVTNPEPIIVEGRHEAIVSEELWNRAQAKRKANATPRVNSEKQTVNPFAGLVRCSQCGHTMTYLPNRGKPMVRCCMPDCPTCATRISALEETVLDVLGGWLTDFTAEGEAPLTSDETTAEAVAQTLAHLRERQTTLNAQLDKLCELVETGAYTVELFTRRKAAIGDQLAATRSRIAELTSQDLPTAHARLIPKLRTVLGAYSEATPAEQNRLLRGVIDHITLTKLQRAERGNPSSHLHIEVFPNLSTDDTPFFI